MQLFGLPNPIVRPILRSPLHRLLSGVLCLITVTGRKSGERFTFPVLYARDGRDVVIVAGWASKKRWWRNVVGGADIELLVAGEHVKGRATAYVDAPAGRGRALRAFLARYPSGTRTLAVDPRWRSLDDPTLGASPGDFVVVRVVPDR